MPAKMNLSMATCMGKAVTTDTRYSQTPRISQSTGHFFPTMHLMIPWTQGTVSNIAINTAGKLH